MSDLRDFILKCRVICWRYGQASSDTILSTFTAQKYEDHIVSIACSDMDYEMLIQSSLPEQTEGFHVSVAYDGDVISSHNWQIASAHVSKLFADTLAPVDSDFDPFEG